MICPQKIPTCVPPKGTKNKIGLQEAFADRNEKGYTWNNLMLSKWVDHDGNGTQSDGRLRKKQSIGGSHAQPEAIIEELGSNHSHRPRQKTKALIKLESDS